MAIKSSFMTAAEAAQAINEITPTLVLASGHYQKASPLINWTIKYWPVAIVIGFLALSAGSATGTIAVQTARKRRK